MKKQKKEKTGNKIRKQAKGGMHKKGRRRANMKKTEWKTEKKKARNG